jgi:hypothetical protein
MLQQQNRKKMKITHTKTIAVAVLLSIAGSAIAHHSFQATFNSDVEITVDGAITDFRFRNPHVIIYLDVTNDDDTVTNWMAEGSAATGWRRSGWANDSLNPGDILRVTGNATHDGSPMISIGELAMLDATGENVIAKLSSNEDPAVALGQSTQAANTDSAGEVYIIPLTLPTGEPNFSGTTMQKQRLGPGGGGPPDANDPDMPYNQLGESALAASSIANDPQVFCDPPGVVRQAGYTPYGFKLMQYPDHITIEYEEYGSRRAIFFSDELPKPGVRTPLGDSVARYESDALIIETVNLLGNFSGHRGKPISDEARVTEVYTRIDDPDVGSIVQTETTVTDPRFLTEPWTINRYKLYSSDYEFIKNECTSPLRERPANTFQYSEFDLQFVE